MFGVEHHLEPEQLAIKRERLFHVADDCQRGGSQAPKGFYYQNLWSYYYPSGVQPIGKSSQANSAGESRGDAMLTKQMVRSLTLIVLVLLAAPATSGKEPKTPIQIYGAWHCSNDHCAWATVRDMADFDTKNHWLIDRGDGSRLPSVNLVILSFVQPMKLLKLTSGPETANGIPIGMNSAVVRYFTRHKVRVMLSVGGSTYTTFWDQALSTNARQLGINAANAAKSLGVGIEIDYENSTNPNLAGLQEFINAYRSVLPYDRRGRNPAARLTIDLAAGDRSLIPLCRKATTDWLNPAKPVIDYANATVPNGQPTASGAESNWQEHVSGLSLHSIPPLAPAKLTGSVRLVIGKNPEPECTNFSASLQNSTGNFVQTVAPNGAGTTRGMLGYMFWGAESQSPQTCEGGVGVGAKTYKIPVPMRALRQQ